jgi:hypothetical protein
MRTEEQRKYHRDKVKELRLKHRKAKSRYGDWYNKGTKSRNNCPTCGMSLAPEYFKYHKGCQYLREIETNTLMSPNEIEYNS